MKKLINYHDFSLVEIFLVLVIIGILGFTGWYVVHAKNSADKDLTANNSTIPTYKRLVTPQTAPPPSTYVGWKTYTTNLGVSFKYPANWFVGTDGAIISVASIQNATSSERGSQEPMSQYDNNLVLSLYDGGASTSQYTAIGKSSSLLQNSLTINGSTYCLVGDHNSATTGNPITEIDVTACKDDTILGGIALKNGHVITTDITSAGDGGAATVAVSQTNEEYATIKLILQSMKF